MKQVVAFVFLLTQIINVSCLDCYVCDDQDDNYDKCVKTVQPCDENENRCMSIVRWGSTPYWTLGAKKQYFISKRCSTRENCNSVKQEFMPRCERTGYNDWECAECCQGDRCNYYVTLGSATVTTNLVIIACGLLLVFLNAF